MQRPRAGQSLAPPGGMTEVRRNSRIHIDKVTVRCRRGLVSHFRVFGLDSKGTTENVCRLQTAVTRPRCCQLYQMPIT